MTRSMMIWIMVILGTGTLAGNLYSYEADAVISELREMKRTERQPQKRVPVKNTAAEKKQDNAFHTALSIEANPITVMSTSYYMMRYFFQVNAELSYGPHALVLQGSVSTSVGFVPQIFSIFYKNYTGGSAMGFYLSCGLTILSTSGSFYSFGLSSGYVPAVIHGIAGWKLGSAEKGGFYVEPFIGAGYVCLPVTTYMTVIPDIGIRIGYQI